MNKWYAVHLDLTDRMCIVVGGGTIAARRILGLIEAGAKVTVISPQCHPNIQQALKEGYVHIISRKYAGPSDIKEADMVFAATNDKNINKQIAEDAKKLRIQINDVGDTSSSSFIIPALLRRGSFMMTVSTSGASPGLAKRLRDELAQQYGDEYEFYVDYLAELRGWVHNHITDEQCRKVIFQQVLKFDIIELIRSDKLHIFSTWLQRLLEQKLQPDEWEQQFRDYTDIN